MNFLFASYKTCFIPFSVLTVALINLLTSSTITNSSDDWYFARFFLNSKIRLDSQEFCFLIPSFEKWTKYGWELI